MSNKIKETSLTCLYITFVDGNQRAFYSRDWNGKTQVVLKKELGIKRLMNLADDYQKKARLKSALLQDLETGKAIQAWPRSL